MFEPKPLPNRAAGAAILAAFAFGIAAAAADESAPNPYLVTIDVRPWIEALRTDDLFETEPAIEGLASLGDHAVPALIAAMQVEGPQARINMVEVLRDIGTPATLPPLMGAAADSDREVRRDAIEALGTLGDAAGRSVVEAALFDDAPEIARTAAIACRSLCHSAAALRRLVELSLDPRSAAGARGSLRQLAKDPGRRDRINALVSEIARPALQDDNVDRRIYAALVVADTGDQAAVPELQACALNTAHPLIAVACVQAVAAVGGDSAIASLAEIVRSSGPVARAAACKALAPLALKDEGARTAHAGCQAASPQ
jgi:HEAT repeat protein